MTTTLRPAYEVHNPSFNDMTLEQQIAVGANDWCAEDENDHPYYGETKAKAEANRAAYRRPNSRHDPVGFARSLC